MEENGFRIIKEKGSIRYYGKPGWPNLVRVDYHGSKEVPTGTCHSILKASGIGHSIEDCLYKAKWGMTEHISLLKEQGLPVPTPNPNPKIIIQNEQELVVA